MKTNMRVVESVASALLDETIAHLEVAIAELPERCRPFRGNSLLNLAIGELVQHYGQAGTAQLLMRVQHELAINQCPNSPETALNPFHLDS